MPSYARLYGLERMADTRLAERFLDSMGSLAEADDDPPFALIYWRLNLPETKTAMPAPSRALET